MKYLLIGLLKTWRLLVSPWYGNVCRYYPSCSAYALRAVSYHGAVKGSWLAARRLLSCHPWAAGGYEPVPGTPEFDEEMRVRRAAAATMETANGPEAGHDEQHTPERGRPRRDEAGHEDSGHEEPGHEEPGQEEAVTVAHERGGK